MKQREIDLRQNKIPAIENLGTTNVRLILYFFTTFLLPLL